MFTAVSNDLFTTSLNFAFSLRGMAKPRIRPIDRVLKWSGKTGVALATELGISPQRLNNWLGRDIPPRQYARVAAIYGRSVEVLVGLAQDDPYIADMMTFWNVLLPESKADIVRHAKYVRTIQNPVPDPPLPAPAKR